MAARNGEGLSRREASKRILKLLAVATGLSVPEVRALLAAGAGAQAAQTPTPWVGGKQPAAKSTPWFSGQTTGSNRNTIVAQKSASNAVKVLKVLLENNRQVFENQFGRSTAIIQRPMGPGRMANVCGVNFGVADAIAGIGGGALGLICMDVNTCSAQDLGGGEGGECCPGTNSCNLQTCSGQTSCGSDSCEEQTCNGEGCTSHSTKIVSAEMLTQFKTDPYIQLLFQEFRVTSADQLAQSIHERLVALAQQGRR